MPSLTAVPNTTDGSVLITLDWDTGPRDVRTNLALNPSVETNATGWAFNSGTSGVVTGGRSTATAGWAGAAFYRATWTTGTTAVNGGVYYTQAGITAGTTYTVSYYARPSVAQTLKIAVEWKDGGGALISLVNGPPVAVTANAWTRFSLTATAPANAVSVVISCYATTGGVNWANGNTLDADALLVEATPTLGAYFDGATANDSIWTYAWTAAADASTSTATPTWLRLNTATLTRVASDGSIVNVRNAEPAQLDDRNTWLGFDYEAPLDLDFYYQATSTTLPGTVITSGAYSLPSGGTTVWLRHPGRPPLNSRITLAEAPTLTRAAAQGVHYVLGRSRPVATTSQRRAQAGTLLVRTDTDDDRAALEALIEDGAVLLLSTPAGWGLGNWYVAVGDVDEDRVVQYGPDTHRLWTLPFAVVDRPAGAAVASGNSWSDALGAYASWQELALAEGTWSGLLAGVG